MNRTSGPQSSRISNDDFIDSSRKHVLLVDHSQPPAGPNLKKPKPEPPPRRSLCRPLSARSSPDNNNNISSSNSNQSDSDGHIHVSITDRHNLPPSPPDQSPETSTETTNSSSPCEKAPQTTLEDEKDCLQATDAAFITQEREDGLCQTEAYFQSANLSSESNAKSSTTQDDGSSRQAECPTTVIMEACQVQSTISFSNLDPDCNEDQDTDFQDVDVFPSIDEIEGWEDFKDDFGDVQNVVVPDNACPICGVDLSTLTITTPDAHVNDCLDNPPPVQEQQPIIEQNSAAGSTFSAIVGTIESVVSRLSSIVRDDNSTNLLPVNQVVPKKTEWQPRTKSSRPCPFYKKMPDTSFTVDAFCYGAIEGCEAYFLTHFHSDHYGGLTSTWNHGPIYCSSITANLVHSRLRVDEKYIRRLPMYEPTVVQGVTVRLMDANHCPGSVLFIFDLEHPKRRYLHTGDFRANPGMSVDPILAQPPNIPIDILYLDTTYSNPRYTFPPQNVVIRETTRLVCGEVGVPFEDDSPVPEPPKPVVQKKFNIMERWLKKESGNAEKLLSLSIKSSQASKAKEKWQEPEQKSKIVICVGTYLIGKERVWMAIAKAMGSKVFVQSSKMEILSCLEDPELMDMLTSNRFEAQVHLMHMGQDMNQAGLQDYLDTLSPTFTRLIAIRPTGWTFTGSKIMTSADSSALDAPSPPSSSLVLKPSFTSSTIKIYPVPYSEHSSFNELAGFVRSLNIHKVIPTVGVGSEKGRHAMTEWIARWKEERRQGMGWE
ncbi:DNA cross-link repair 1A protein [Entomortierella parvispora]|uniref:DNA cross-link repair 1A protein n=1 Tax=Entomortierella parvispora TaxID=205924 RepID=A0A9P3HGD5_9FUNG|nr:DNA cross-link repair 1A protein [Entomortierella parvispora]